MTLVATIIFAAIILSGLLEIYLERRQLAAVAAHRNQVPAAFLSALTIDEHRRAADYTLARTRLTLGRRASTRS